MSTITNTTAPRARLVLAHAAVLTAAAAIGAVRAAAQTWDALLGRRRTGREFTLAGIPDEDRRVFWAALLDLAREMATEAARADKRAVGGDV